MSPATILIVGGNGLLARHMTQRFASKGMKVHSIIRNPDQALDLRRLGASPIVQSIDKSDVFDIVALIQNIRPDAVIWSAGAGGAGASAARLQSVDNEGHIKVMDAVAYSAQNHGTTRRFITISALEVRDDINKKIPEWYDDKDKEFSIWLWSIFRPYFQARLASDKSLVQGNIHRGLDYTIIRPGWMSQDTGRGRVATGRCRITERVSREDVTTVVDLSLWNLKTVGLAFDVAGGEVPIKDAIERAQDCFEGHY